MTRHRISPAGPEFSRLIYGTWRILDDEDAANKTPQALMNRFKACVDMGITTLDTAEIYGLYLVEEAIGGALKIDKVFRDQIEIGALQRHLTAHRQKRGEVAPPYGH
jgi:predicted oxidoreductase